MVRSNIKCGKSCLINLSLVICLQNSSFDQARRGVQNPGECKFRIRGWGTGSSFMFTYQCGMVRCQSLLMDCVFITEVDCEDSVCPWDVNISVPFRMGIYTSGHIQVLQLDLLTCVIVFGGAVIFLDSLYCTGDAIHTALWQLGPIWSRKLI